MNDIKVVLTERVKKDYQTLPLAIQKKFKKQVRFLQANPKYPSLQIHLVGPSIGNFILITLIAACSVKRGQSITCLQQAHIK
jgi:hypothetical protein